MAANGDADAVAPLTTPTRPTLYHMKWWSSSRPLHLLLELGVAGGADAQVDVVQVSKEQLRDDPLLVKLNPQRRLPLFRDPDTDVTLTESGGLVQYLLETYDKDHALHPPLGDPRRPLFLQLVHFGPASGYHIAVPILFRAMPPDNDESQRTKQEECDRKMEEWRKICVPTIEQALDKHGGPYLLGKDFSAADIVNGYELMTISFTGRFELIGDYPKIQAYYDLICRRDIYKKIYLP